MMAPQAQYGEDGFYKQPVVNRDQNDMSWYIWDHIDNDHKTQNVLIICSPIGHEEYQEEYELWKWLGHQADGDRWWGRYFKCVAALPSLEAAKVTHRLYASGVLK